MNNENTPLVKLEGISRTFHDGERELPVLKSVNLELKNGESLAILGKSGSGKSTLLHILGLLDKPTSGTYEFSGEDMTNCSEGKKKRLRNREIGFVFQHFHLLPELSALENALLPARLSGETSKARPKAEELLCKLGLKERLRHKPSKLSGGEQQRIAIVRALINSPALLLCDEPTGNLDTNTSQAVFEELFRLQKEMSQTLVLVTHDPDLAKQADRILELERGILTT